MKQRAGSGLIRRVLIEATVKRTLIALHFVLGSLQVYHKNIDGILHQDDEEDKVPKKRRTNQSIREVMGEGNGSSQAEMSKHPKLPPGIVDIGILFWLLS